MTHISHPIRPARAAIAAVLALTATPLLAQEMQAPSPALPEAQPIQQAAPPAAPPAVTSVPQATQPTAALPGNPVPMASPVAPATQPVPEMAAPGMPITSIAPPATVTRPAATPERTVIARETTRGNAAPVERAPVVAETTPLPQDNMDAAMPTDGAIAPAAPALNAPIATQQPQASAPDTVSGDQTNGEVWGWMAALLAALGLGGGAIALSRSRTRGAATGTVETSATGPSYRDMVPLAQAETGLAGPHDRPVMTSPVATPAMALPTTPARIDQPVRSAMQQTGVKASAPAAAPRASTLAGDIDPRRLEYMIAQRPSRDNPFVTRSNRKRRAVFLLQNRYPIQNAA